MIMVKIMIIMITAMLWHCTVLLFCTVNNHNPYTYTEVLHICLSTLQTISLSPVTLSAIKDKHIFKQSSSILDVALCYYSPYCLEMYIKKPGKNILNPSHSCICGCHSPVFFFLMTLTFIIIMGLYWLHTFSKHYSSGRLPAWSISLSQRIFISRTQNTKTWQNMHVPSGAQNVLSVKILVGAEILNQILLCLTTLERTGPF